MNPEEVALLRRQADEVEKVRERMHKIADMVQNHEGKMAEHSTIITVLSQELETLKLTLASKESVAAGTALLSLKIDQLNQTMDPIRRGVYWVVTVIVGAVILALLALVIRGGA